MSVEEIKPDKPRVKRLPPATVPIPQNPKRVTTTDGWNFGLGFWLAWAAVFLVFLPVLGCLAFIVLSVMGNSL